MSHLPRNHPLRSHVALGAVALGAALTASATAQCQFSTLTARSTGVFCNIGSTGCCAVAGGPTQLVAALDQVNCTVELGVRAIEGCCSVTIPLRLIAIGATPAAVPLPQLGAGCTLWLVPDAAFALTGSTLSLAIPPTLPPLTFLAQGAALIVDVSQPPATMTLTEAQAISLQ